mgnify:CR=1 FL=1
MSAKITINTKAPSKLELKVGEFYLIKRMGNNRLELHLCVEDSDKDFSLISLEDGIKWCTTEATLERLLHSAVDDNYEKIIAVDKVRIYVD